MRTRTMAAASGDSCAGMVAKPMMGASRARVNVIFGRCPAMQFPASRRLERVDVRQVPREASKRAALVAAAPHLARRGAEVDAGGVARIARHGLPLHGPPRLRFRQALVLPLPAAAAVARSIHGR